MKYILIGLLVTLKPLQLIAQDINSSFFVRTPQVVNFNFNQKQVSYTPLISIGSGLSHKKSFIELATFISQDDVYGFYTFFGSNLKVKELSNGFKLNTNWFGELSYIPNQAQIASSTTYTSGICFFFNYGLRWGTVGLPLCIGTAYSQKTISLNTRTILNFSLNIN